MFLKRSASTAAVRVESMPPENITPIGLSISFPGGLLAAGTVRTLTSEALTFTLIPLPLYVSEARRKMHEQSGESPHRPESLAYNRSYIPGKPWKTPYHLNLPPQAAGSFIKIFMLVGARSGREISLPGKDEELFPVGQRKRCRKIKGGV